MATPQPTRDREIPLSKCVYRGFFEPTNAPLWSSLLSPSSHGCIAQSSQSSVTYSHWSYIDLSRKQHKMQSRGQCAESRPCPVLRKPLTHLCNLQGLLSIVGRRRCSVSRWDPPPVQTGSLTCRYPPPHTYVQVLPIVRELTLRLLARIWVPKTHLIWIPFKRWVWGQHNSATMNHHILSCLPRVFKSG